LADLKVQFGFRVARWFVFKPKIPIWVNFEGLRLQIVDIFYGHLGYFMTIWYILSGFGIMHQEKSGNPVWLHKSGPDQLQIEKCCCVHAVLFVFRWLTPGVDVIGEINWRFY
jgi:hypothetical protein